MLAPATTEIVLYKVLAALPHFNPDVEEDTLPLVVRNFVITSKKRMAYSFQHPSTRTRTWLAQECA